MTQLNHPPTAHNQPPHPFNELLDSYEYAPPQQGQILEGQILFIYPDAVYVDVGAKRDAIVPHDEMVKLGESLLAGLSAGDQVPVYVTHTPVGNQELIVSIDKGLQKYDWLRAKEAYASGEILNLTVIGVNKGGLLVELGRLEGFVPNSHVPELRRIRDPRQQQVQKARLLDTQLKLKIIDLDESLQRLVMSAVAAQTEERQALLNTLKPGQQVTGRVTAVTSFGAFVDLGGIDGLIHISRLAHHHVQHPSEVLSVGDEVTVLVEKVDVARERISLNRQAVLLSPWEALPKKHKSGDLVEGRVTNLADFGVFVRIDSGVVGLVHISEITLPPNSSLKDMFQAGETILVRIIDMVPEDQRLSLSRRRVTVDEELAWMAARATTTVEAETETEPEPAAEMTTATAVALETETEAKTEAKIEVELGTETDAEAEVEMALAP